MPSTAALTGSVGIYPPIERRLATIGVMMNVEIIHACSLVVKKGRCLGVCARVALLDIIRHRAVNIEDNKKRRTSAQGLYQYGQ